MTKNNLTRRYLSVHWVYHTIWMPRTGKIFWMTVIRLYELSISRGWKTWKSFYLGRCLSKRGVSDPRLGVNQSKIEFSWKRQWNDSRYIKNDWFDIFKDFRRISWPIKKFESLKMPKKRCFWGFLLKSTFSPEFAGAKIRFLWKYT